MTPADDGVGRVIPGRIAWAALAIVAIYLILLASLSRSTGGLNGRYTITPPGGERITVHERIDPRVDFAIPQRLDAAYLFHWDNARYGHPELMPPYDIDWTGILRVPRDGSYGFTVEAQGEVDLAIDDRPLRLQAGALTERPLRAGAHPIRVSYRLPQGTARIILRWRPPGGRVEVISDRFLFPDEASIAAAGRRRAAAWIVLLFGLAPAAAMAMLARRPATPAARLAGALWDERTRIALGLLLMLAAVLRFHDHALVPFHHETADEYQHAWEGWHLLQERVPAAWSTFPEVYPTDRTHDFRWFGDRYTVVRPYFDHPPLFSLLVGLSSTLGGARDYLSCTLPVMRIVPILLSLIGLLLLYRLARLYGAEERAALLAGLVYAVLPPIVLAHRLVKAESLLVLLFMGAILAAGRSGEEGSRRGAILAGLLCALSIWTKATGLAVCGTILILLLARRRRRDAAIVAAMTVAGAGLYLLYAFAYDFDLFLAVVKAQTTSKWVSLDAMLDLLEGKVVVQWFGRGWYLWLLLAAGVAAFRRERSLLLPMVIYGILVVMTADHRVIFGWYRTPLLPFLCIAAGIYLHEMLREPDLFRTFPFAASAVATGFLYALPEGVTATKGMTVLFALLAVAPFLPRLMSDHPLALRLARGGAALLLLCFLLASLATVGGLVEIYAAMRGMR
jgi:hypothetical protein